MVASLAKSAHVRLFLTVPTTSQFVNTIRKAGRRSLLRRRPWESPPCRKFASISISMNSNARTAKSRLDTYGLGTISSFPQRSVNTAAGSFSSFKTNRGSATPERLDSSHRSQDSHSLRSNSGHAHQPSRLSLLGAIGEQQFRMTVGAEWR